MKDKRGFTLIELIIVLSILSIISAIAMPRYSNIIGRQKEKACLVSRKHIIDTYHNYKLIYPELEFSDFMDSDNINRYLKISVIEGKIKCPGGGTYTVERNKLICSIHGLSYVDINTSEVYSYNFTSEDFEENSIDNLLQLKSGWKWSRQDGLYNDDTGEQRVFLDNELDYYKMSTLIKLDGDVVNNNGTMKNSCGYGIIFESHTVDEGDNRAKDTSYIFQFDPGYNGGKFILRERVNGSEKTPFLVINPSEVLPETEIDKDFWLAEHEIEVEVTEYSESEKQIKIFIDNIEITENQDPSKLIIDKIDNTNSVGYRTWVNSNAYVKDLIIEEIE